jgi:hypothetical protein
MTRGQVARYLGKSIATVRRIEGRHLHPHRDARGIFQFQPGEVRELREALNRGELRLTRINFTRDRAPSTSNRPVAPAADPLVSVRRQLSELRAVARDAVELFYLVCPDRFLEELEPEVLDAFDAVLAKTDPVGS